MASARATAGKIASALGLVARVAVGHRHELHFVSEFREVGRRAGRAEVAIVGMRAKDDHTDFSL